MAKESPYYTKKNHCKLGRPPQWSARTKTMENLFSAVHVVYRGCLPSGSVRLLFQVVSILLSCHGLTERFQGQKRKRAEKSGYDNNFQKRHFALVPLAAASSFLGSRCSFPHDSLSNIGSNNIRVEHQIGRFRGRICASRHSRAATHRVCARWRVSASVAYPHALTI